MTKAARSLALTGLVLILGGAAGGASGQDEVEIERPDPPALDDFETDANRDGVPDGWYNARDVTLIAEGGKVGPHCLKFEVRKPGRPARLSRAFGLDGRKHEAIIIGPNKLAAPMPAAPVPTLPAATEFAKVPLSTPPPALARAPLSTPAPPPGKAPRVSFPPPPTPPAPGLPVVPPPAAVPGSEAPPPDIGPATLAAAPPPAPAPPPIPPRLGRLGKPPLSNWPAAADAPPW